MEKKESELYDINIQKDYFNSIVEIAEDYLKFVNTYKSLTKDYVKNIKKAQKKLEEKMKITKVVLENNKNIDFSYIFIIINSFPSINKCYLENLHFFLKDMEKSISSLEKYIEEKKYLLSKFLDNLNDSKIDLQVKLNDLEKEKNNYFNNLTKTENAISEFYTNKLKIENYSKNITNMNNPNPNELKNLFIQNNNLEETMNKLINESKKSEKNYKSIITYSKVFKKAFIDSSNITHENIQSILFDFFVELKKFIQNIIILQKNCYAIPLKEIDTHLSKLILKKEEDDKIMKDLFSNTETKVGDEFPIVSKKYTLQTFNNNTDIYTKKPFLTLEDGLDEINYLDNDLQFYTAKTMFSSFNSIDDKYKINFEEEEEKRNTKQFISNILLNIEKKSKKSENKKNNKDKDKDKDNIINDNNIINNNKENENKELQYIHQNEINQLYSLLDKHYNRVIFLQTISQFRTSGKFCLPSKVYEIIGKCLTIIIDTIMRDQDYHCAKSAIILSQTYFCLKDNKRYYLDNLIKKHKLFTNLEFWEKTLDYSIKKEIIKTNKNKKKYSENKIKNDINNDINIKNEKEDEKEKGNELKIDLNKEKYDDIAFGQIASLVNSMIDFDINIKDVRKIIEPKIEFYKLTKNHKSNIELIIDNKLNMTKNGNEIIENKEKEENIENNIENREKDKNIENNIENKEKEKNIENNIESKGKEKNIENNIENKEKEENIQNNSNNNDNNNQNDDKNENNIINNEINVNGKNDINIDKKENDNNNDNKEKKENEKES